MGSSSSLVPIHKRPPGFGDLVIWSPHHNLPPEWLINDRPGFPTQKRFYVAGPMRGYEKWNFPAFDSARNRLLREGHEVISPADLDRARGVFEDTIVFDAEDFAYAIRIDTLALMSCTGIYLLRGWEASTGAKYEHVVARTFGLEVVYEEGATTDKAEIAVRG